MENSFEKAMDFRHACKIFDKNKSISDEDIRYILQAGIKSPSSFGVEPWKFLVITNQELKEKIKALAWNQPQVDTCSHLVLLLAAIEDVKPSSGIPKQRFSRREDAPQEKIDFYVDLYTKYFERAFQTDEQIYSWSSEQVHIAMGNMATAGAIKGIDSCPLGGFQREEVEDLLNIDRKKYRVCLLLPFGYRLEEQAKQYRESFETMVEFIK